MLIRTEQTAEYAVVEKIHESAFAGTHEANVVRAIRQSAGYRPEWSLVAEDSGTIAGHVLFSYIGLQDDAGNVRRVVVLAPLAVLPQSQRRGVGSALVRHGIELLESQSEPLIILRGDLAYYGRFGFQPSVELRIHAPFPIASDHYLVRRLRAFTPDYCGCVRYPAAFRAVGYETTWSYR
jgi:putative acetyltransferase